MKVGECGESVVGEVEEESWVLRFRDVCDDGGRCESMGVHFRDE